MFTSFTTLLQSLFKKGPAETFKELPTQTEPPREEDERALVEKISAYLKAERLAGNEPNAEAVAHYQEFADSIGWPKLASFLGLIAKPAISLSVSELQPAPESTRVGGYPYVPATEDFTWPVNSAGEKLTFVLQVNFSELPRLEGTPESGLLQWWVDGHSDTWGLTFTKEDTGREGLYLKHYSAEQLTEAKYPIDAELPSEDELGEPPLFNPEKSFGFTAKLDWSLPSGEGVYKLEEELRGLYGELEDALYERKLELPFQTNAIQVAGYPHFVQGDPRDSSRPGEFLLQVESFADLAGKDIIMWGDVGNAQLFGDFSKLAEGDLSEFWWDWACY